MNDPSSVMAFDFGLRRIGVAIGNALIDTANPLVTIHNSKESPNWPELESLVKEWAPDLLIVGLPLMLDGRPSSNATAAEAFATELAARTGRKVLLVDEKLSSTAAKEQLKAGRASGLRKRTKSGDIDKFAAQVILRTWLNQRDGQPPHSGGE